PPISCIDEGTNWDILAKSSVPNCGSSVIMIFSLPIIERLCPVGGQSSAVLYRSYPIHDRLHAVPDRSHSKVDRLCAIPDRSHAISDRSPTSRPDPSLFTVI